MARSVDITTPIPTLEEFGESLGLSKSRQDSLLRLVRRDRSGNVAERRRDGGVVSVAKREPARAFRSKK
jgi:hypothetical protein